ERLGIYFDSESNVAYICGTRYIGELKKRFLSLGMHMVKKNGLGVGFHSSTKEMRVLDRDGRPRQSTMVVMGMSATGKSTLGFARHGLPSEGEEYVRIANDDFSFFHYEDKKFYGSEMNPYNKSNDFTDPDDRFHKGVIMSENNGVQDGKLTYGDVYGPNGRCIVSRRAIDNTFDGVNLPIDGGENVYFIIIQRNPTLPPMMRVRDIDMLIASFLSVETVYTNAENVPPDLVGKTRHQVGANPFILSSMEEEVKAVKKAFEITKGVGICLNTSSYFFRDIKKETSGWLLEQLARDRIDWEMDEFYNMEVPAMSTPDFDDFNLRYHPTAVMTDSDMARKKREYHEMHDRKVVFLRDLGVDERYAEAIRGKS
ncbi:MAG: phosphoenolpyruvate carboxykinase (ATP), partial [Thermoplasmata archaeon]|nr:phosphoenolpyruvate carboxykinase (ATP) [Thermoplasmata archaeon]